MNEGERVRDAPAPARPGRWIRAGLYLLLLAALGLGSWAAVRLIRGDGRQSTELVASPEGWLIIAPDREVSSLLLVGDTLYAGGMEGIVTVDVRSGEVTGALETPIPLVLVKSLVQSRDGKIWAAHQNGVTVFDGDAIRTMTTADGLPDNRVNALLEARDGRLWAGTFGGAAVFDGSAWRPLTRADGLLDDMVGVLYEDSRGWLWFGNYVLRGGGVTYVGPDTMGHFTVETGLAHNAITSIVEDQQGRIWIGSGALTRGGANVAVWQDRRWALTRSLGIKDGLAGEKVRLIYPDDHGRLWFCSEYDGIAILRSGDLQPLYRLTEREGLSHNEVKAIVADRDGNLWLGAHQGITKIPRAYLDRMP
jgi:ligand-binding sensor domain-containing protein